MFRLAPSIRLNHAAQILQETQIARAEGRGLNQAAQMAELQSRFLTLLSQPCRLGLLATSIQDQNNAPDMGLDRGGTAPQPSILSYGLLD